MAWPHSQFHEEFAHRINRDGTADSICLYCFMTAASSPEESTLEKAELTHACWQRKASVISGRPRMPAVNSRAKNHKSFPGIPRQNNFR